MKGLPIIISGPSGSGKTSLYNKAIKDIENLTHSVSYTTRPLRGNEKYGEDYYFISEEMFDWMAARGEFLEYFKVHNDKYGTSKSNLNRSLDNGFDVILSIDVQGAKALMKILPEAVFIFISPPSAEVCRKRLMDRGENTLEEINKRMVTARKEMTSIYHYDYNIINYSLDNSYKILKSIIQLKKAQNENC